MENFLKNEYVDKTLAFLACIPLIWVVIMRLRFSIINIPEGIFLLNLMIVIVPTLFRRPPARVSLNFYYWILAIAGTYWPIIWYKYKVAGIFLFNPIVYYVLIFLVLFLNIYSRWSLGLSIGFVASDRGIKKEGAYQWVRHPIYTTLILNSFVTLFSDFHSINLLIYFTHSILYLVKAIVEERFLMASPDYKSYAKTVKYRFIPKVI